MKMKWFGSLLVMLLLVWPPVAHAATVLDYAQSAGVQVAQQPPQASAEALLKLPSVYVLPGSFAYWIKQLVEGVQLLFTTKPEDRAGRLMDMSNQRLAEGYQAVKEGKWQAALTSMQRYQQEQQSLRDSLDKLDGKNSQWQPLVSRLQQQLQIQQSLQHFVQTQAHKDKEAEAQANQVGELLGQSIFQHLAYVSYPNQAVLGIEDRGQSTSSAQASQSAVQATSSATASAQRRN